MTFLIGIGLGTAFVALLVTLLAWMWIGDQIRGLSGRVKDYLLIVPTSPGVQGAVSARLFEAMKDVCETAKAHAHAHKRWQEAQKNSTALVSDVDILQKEWWEAGRKAETALEWLKKVEGSHQIGQK